MAVACAHCGLHLSHSEALAHAARNTLLQPGHRDAGARWACAPWSMPRSSPESSFQRLWLVFERIGAGGPCCCWRWARAWTAATVPDLRLAAVVQPVPGGGLARAGWRAPRPTPSLGPPHGCRCWGGFADGGLVAMAAGGQHELHAAVWHSHPHGSGAGLAAGPGVPTASATLVLPGGTAWPSADNTQEYLQAALTGTGYFMVAYLAHQLAQRR